MARYIDADAFLEKMKTTPRYFSVKFGIEEMPTADVAEIVRCKDCQWWHRDGCAFRTDCVEDIPSENDFCSQGELKKKYIGEDTNVPTKSEVET